MATAKRLPSGSYRVRVYVNDLKAYKSFTADSKRGAERMANDWLIEHEEEVRREQMLTFEKAANAYIEQRRTTLSPTTIAGYETIMKNNVERLKDIALDELTQQQIQDWVNELTVSLSPKSVRNIYGFFKSVVNYHDVPLRLSKIQLPRKTRKFKRLPSAQLVIDTFKGTDIELPVLLAVWGSLRMSEILGIQARDIEGDVLTISRVKVKVNNETVVKERAKTYNSNRQLVHMADEEARLSGDVPRSSPHQRQCDGSAQYPRPVRYGARRLVEYQHAESRIPADIQHRAHEIRCCDRRLLQYSV